MPELFGMKRAPMESLAGGDAVANAAIIRAILAGEKSPKRDVVLLNAAAALVAAGRADSIMGGLPAAAESIDSGAAQAKLNLLIEFTTAQTEICCVARRPRLRVFFTAPGTTL